MAGEARRKNIREIHRNHRLFYELLGGVVLLAVGILLGALWLEVDILADGSADYRMNLVTEGMGIVATVFIINRWYAHRDRERQREQAQLDEERQTGELKQRLIREAGSGSNDIAIRAIEQLREKGWLVGRDSLLKGEILSKANLRNADLQVAYLVMTDFSHADLESVNLNDAILRRAFLNGANLQGAMLIDANLRDAKLSSANLQGAKLTRANLRGANVDRANLQGAFLINAKLQGVNFSYFVTLPDGTRNTSATDMSRFTDTDHPDFPATLERIIEIRKSLKFND